MEQQEESLSKFFDRWQSFPDEGVACLTPTVLATLSKQSESEWADRESGHLKTCSHCHEVLKLLQGIVPEGDLRGFLEMTRERAQVGNDRRFFSPGRFKALFTGRWPAWRTAALTASAIMLVVSFLYSDELLRLSRPDNEVATISLEADPRYKMQQVAEEYALSLKASAEQLRKKPDVQISDLQQYGRTFNAKTDEINAYVNAGQLKGELYQTCRASEADFRLSYNRRLQIVTKRTGSQTSAPSIDVTPDAETFEALLVNVAREIPSNSSLKKNGVEDGALTAEQAIKAINLGSQQIDIRGIDENLIVIQDKKLDRNPMERKAIEDAVNAFVKQRNVDVNFNVGYNSAQVTSKTHLSLAPAWYQH